VGYELDALSQVYNYEQEHPGGEFQINVVKFYLGVPPVGVVRLPGTDP
jgi:hypothetical protein